MAAGLVGLLLGGCGSAALVSAGAGKVDLTILPSASVASSVSLVGARLTVSPGSGPAFDPFTVELSSVGGQLGASLSGVPAGQGRQFSIVGYDASAAIVAQGSTVADVAAGVASRIVVVMNPPPGGGPSLDAPIIDQLTLTQSTVAPLGPVELRVSAHATDGSAVVLAWSADCGTFASDPTAASVTWIAPATAGSCAVAVTASGSSGVSITAQLSITVAP